MFSLKHIITEADMDSPDSHIFLRSKASARTKKDLVASLISLKPIPTKALEDSADSTSVKNPRSTRVLRPSVTGPISQSAPNSARRPSSGKSDSMESLGHSHSKFTEGNLSNSTKALSSGSQRTEPNVRYTPVTGRISRAKKGRHVHLCNQCQRIFSRAEHLRRHELSHDQPKFICKKFNCSRSFHRPDLLARHMSRHDTGEDELSSDRKERRRSSSTSMLDSPLSTSKAKGPSPLIIDTSTVACKSPTILASDYTPSTGSASANTITACESSIKTSHCRSYVKEKPLRHTDGTMPRSYPSEQAIRSASLLFQDDLGVFQSSTTLDFSPKQQYVDLSPWSPQQPPSDSGYQSMVSDQHSVPQLSLQVPDSAYAPRLNNTNSPWCVSESPWSTPSDSRNGSSWPRERSESIATNPGWSEHPSLMSPQHPSTPRNQRSPSLEILADNIDPNLYGSPMLSPPLVSYHSSRSSASEDPSGFVGTPPFTKQFKMTQQFSESNAGRVSSHKHTRRNDIPMVAVDDSNRYQLPLTTVYEQDQLQMYVPSFRTRPESPFPNTQQDYYDNGVNQDAKMFNNDY